VKSPNEKEISHGRASWQTRCDLFDQGLLASIVWFGLFGFIALFDLLQLDGGKPA
jgi:hypothetical protein